MESPGECSPTEPLIKDGGREYNSISSSKPEGPVTLTQCRGCTFYMEPLIFLVAFFQFPLFIILPQYVLDRELKRLIGTSNISVSRNSCEGINSDNENITGYDPIRGNYTLAQSAAAIFQLESSLVSSIPALVTVIVVGSLGDKRGRKFGIYMSLTGMAISVLNGALNAFFEWPVELLLVGQFVNGCMGSWITLFMTSSAYCADVTDKKSRQMRMVILQLSAHGAYVISTAGSGYMVDSLGFAGIFSLIFIVTILLILYTLFVVPETVLVKRNTSIISMDFFKRTFYVVIKDDNSKRRMKVFLLMGAAFFCLMGEFGATMDTLFELNQPLCWNSDLVGIQSSLGTAVKVIGSALSAWILNLCLRDVWIAMISAFMHMACYIYMFFVTTTIMMLFSSVFKITDALIGPTVRSMLSKIVQPNEIGAIFGAVAVVEGLCQLISGVIYNPIYSTSQAVGMPSLVFLVIAGVSLIGTLIFLIYAVLTRNDEDRMEDMEKSIN